MKIKVPKEVRESIRKAEEAESRRRRARREANDAESRRLRKIGELRIARRDELWQCALEVFAWRAAFVELKESTRIWELVGDKTKLPIFAAGFHRGEPSPDDPHAQGRLSFEAWTAGAFGLPPLWYEETYNMSFGASRSGGVRIGAPQELIDAVHPDFLRQLREHLRGPDAWKHILRELDRLAKG